MDIRNQKLEVRDWIKDRKKQFFVLLLFSIVCFLLFIRSCDRKTTKVKETVIPVEVVIIQEKELQKTLQFTGDIKGKDQVQVYSKVTGKLIEYKVKEGTRVEKKDVIALIDRDVTGFKFEPAPVEASISGVVAKTYLDQGDSVSSQVPIAVVANMDEVKIKIEVTEVDYPKVKVGQSAKIALDAYLDKEFTGKLSKLSVLVDPNTRTATAEITIPNPEHLLVPGMFARITLFAGEHRTLVAPRDAILRLPGTGVYYCFTIQGNEAKKVFIELGIQKNNQQEITKGLKRGDLVVVIGQGILKPGSAVEIKKIESLGK